jgi:hypothetical protein
MTPSAYAASAAVARSNTSMNHGAMADAKLTSAIAIPKQESEASLSQFRRVKITCDMPGQ